MERVRGILGRGKMRDRTKNIISIILPLITIFVIAFTLKTQPTGLAIYENKTLYKINGSIGITLQDKIPADSYIRIKIDDYIIKINIIEFLKKSGGSYKISEGFIIANNTYSLDFTSLGIIRSFEKGKHKIKTEIVYKNSVLYGDEEIVNI